MLFGLCSNAPQVNVNFFSANFSLVGGCGCQGDVIFAQLSVVDIFLKVLYTTNSYRQDIAAKVVRLGDADECKARGHYCTSFVPLHNTNNHYYHLYSWILNKDTIFGNSVFPSFG